MGVGGNSNMGGVGGGWKKIKDVHERIKIIRTIYEINLIKVMV